MVNETSTARLQLRALSFPRVKTLALGIGQENIENEVIVVSLALCSLPHDLPIVPSVERRPSSPDVAAIDAQRAQVFPPDSDIRSSNMDNDAGASADPYAQIDSLLAGLRDLTLGGAALRSASTPAQANAAYAAYA